MTDAWLDFIILCRSGQSHDYDIVIGTMANDQIYNFISDYIEERGIPCGSFDNISICEYSVPTHWDIGKVYKRLILMIAREEEIEAIDALIAAYHSKTSNLIQNYNGSFYYENPQTIFDTYQHGGNPA
ncbi:DUF3990 domain-containing protein [bacterium 1XD42-54]|nr:DUF3990 domain-containing protein [bacterium 1XD42-54]